MVREPKAKILYRGNIMLWNPGPDYSGVPDGTTGKLKAQCGCPVGKKLASDEKICVVDPDAEPVDPSCAPWDFTCANGRCIQKTWSWKCDGTPDCEDESDEPESCGKVTCPNTHFQCNNTRCIFHSWLCDGEEDCRDCSDETNPEACGKPGFRCGSEQWQCENINHCINITQSNTSKLPMVVSVYVKRGRNCEAAVTLSVKTLMNVHHLVFTPRSVPMAKASTGVLVLSDTHLILIRKPARLHIILWPT
ncbi:hypothetical protein Pmani_002797 [Petrolisthes manimaculis]|uniref:Uncharacterized protein n=1 Tax=Petrolisthes manimaculis TaxID=1843537 RepID=A0AAE1UQ58_9EUCA|nr:hypothetical protein Pmani_002797 [Petrolisthes manimaculis]